MIILDTESGDPDDILVIAYLADKGLAAVNLHPGTNEQVGLVKAVLKECGVNVPVGGTGSTKSCVSSFYSQIYDFKPQEPDGAPSDILKDFLPKGAKVLTCGLPKNIDGVQVEDWWAQGGYCPHDLMPEKFRLPKFKDVQEIQSFNFSNRRLIQRCIENTKTRHFISKNICHGVLYDKTRTSKNPVIKRIMDIYLQRHDQKAFHDLLAAWAMLNPQFMEWAEVEMYYVENRVGCRLSPGSNTFISVGYDADKFWGTI